MSIARLSLFFVIFLFLIATSAHGQSVARSKLSEPETLISEPTTLTETSDDSLLAIRATAALKRLEKDVLIYRSLGDFEENGKLARVTFEAFKNDLQEVICEVEPLLSRLPPSKLKIELTNALDSYRDGAFWWAKIYQPRVVNVSALAFAETTRTPSDTAFLASKYLKRAEELMNGKRK